MSSIYVNNGYRSINTEKTTIYKQRGCFAEPLNINNKNKKNLC